MSPSTWMCSNEAKAEKQDEGNSAWEDTRRTHQLHFRGILGKGPSSAWFLLLPFILVAFSPLNYAL